MPPAIVLVGFGQSRRIVLPLPFFLLWPLIALAWLVLGLVWLIVSRRPRAGHLMTGLLALRVLSELRGTRVNLDGEDGSLYLRFI